MLGVGVLDQTEEQLGKVADDDEGRSQCWTTVVLHNQVVPLKLPEDICVSLHYLKRVTGRTCCGFVFFFFFEQRSLFKDQVFFFLWTLPEHGNEQV